MEKLDDIMRGVPVFVTVIIWGTCVILLIAGVFYDVPEGFGHFMIMIFSVAYMVFMLGYWVAYEKEYEKWKEEYTKRHNEVGKNRQQKVEGLSTTNPATIAQLDHIYELQRKLNMASDIFDKWILEHFDVTEYGKLTQAQATKAIEILNKRLKDDSTA